MTQYPEETGLVIQIAKNDVAPFVPPDTTDLHFIEMWIHGKGQNTREAYRREAYRFLFFLEQETPKQATKSLLRQVTLVDLQDFADTLNGVKPATKARSLKAVKSLFTYAHKTGFHTINVGAAVNLPKIKRRLAQRILTEEQVHRIIAQEEDHPRNHALLRFLYISGARISEACNLAWKDYQDREFGMGQVTLDGKGEKERTVLLPESMCQELKALRQWESERLHRSIEDYEPLFLRAHGNGKTKEMEKQGIDPSQAHRIVEAAAVGAKVQIYQGEQRRKNRLGEIEVKEITKSRVSPHFFRHAHASHALDRGVPPHVVIATLGHASLEILTAYAHAKPTESSALKLSI
jgi:integrase/recombinase XerD